MRTILYSFVILFFVSTSVNAGDHWQQTAGPYGGIVNGIATKGDHLVFAILSTGLYRSTDAGLTWTTQSTGFFGAFSVYSGIAVDSSGMIIALGHSQGLVTSTDDGDTWLEIDAGIADARSYENIVAAPDGALIMFVTDSAGESLYRSTDSAMTWTAIPRTGLPVATDFNAISFGKNYMFANLANQTTGATSLYRSSNNGTSWQLCGATVLPQTDTISEVNALRNGAVFVATEQIVNNEYQYRNFRSTDDGATWSEISSAVPPFTAVSSVVQAGSLGLLSTVYKQENEQICGCRVFVFVDLMHSTDNGASWNSISGTGREGVPIQTIVATNVSVLFALGQRGGMYRSIDNGQTWELSVNGLRAAVVHSIAADNSGNIFAGTLESGVYRSMNEGTTWERMLSGIPGAGSFQLLGSQTGAIIAADTSRGVFHSSDQGDTWVSTNTGLSDPRVTAIAGDGAGNVYVGTRTGVFVSADDGLSWTSCGTGIPAGITVYALSMNEKGMSYAGTTEGVFRSSNAGTTWSIASNGLVNLRIYSLGQLTDGTAFAGTYDGFFRSDDNGTSWVASDSGMVHGDTYVSSIFPQSDGSILATAYVTTFAVPPVGIFRSTNGGHKWIRNDTGITIRPSVTWGLAQGKNGAKYLATSTMGVLKAGGTTGVDQQNVVTPSSSGLRVYPIPARQQLTVTIEQSVSPISVSLFDCLGREINHRDCKSDRETASQFTMDISTLPPGVYHIRMATKRGYVEQPVMVE